MKRTLKYSFSFCLLLSLFLAKAQETTATKPQVNKTAPIEQALPEPPKQVTKKTLEATKIDTTTVKKDRYGLRVGVDLYKLTRGLYDDDYKGIEFTGDFRLTKKYYLAAEIGTEDKTTDDDRLNSTAKGSYIKAGFDYNIYENWLDMENLITIGMRYGASTFSQELNSYKIYNPNPYWGEVPEITANEKFSGLTASWAEVIAGIKAQVLPNVFMGFSLQLKMLVTNNKPETFDNLYIPGFNRTYDGDFGAGFNYTVSYFIPLYKKKAIAAEENN